MSWKRLTPDDMRLVLAEDEIDKLNNFNKSEELYDIIQKQLDLIAAQFRGAFTAKNYVIDVRDYYLPEEYHHAALVIARYLSWSRFPNSHYIALDEPREKEYIEAKELLKNPYIGTSAPDYSGMSPEDPDYDKVAQLSATTKDLITMPWLRVPPFPWQYGYPEVFGKKDPCNCCHVPKL